MIGLPTTLRVVQFHQVSGARRLPARRCLLTIQKSSRPRGRRSRLQV
jgi:hypothetical protein